MERLTEKIPGTFDNGKWRYRITGSGIRWRYVEDFGETQNAINRLSEYEDTGLMPEEIKDNMDIFKAYRHVCGGKSPEEIMQMIEEFAKLKSAFNSHEDEVLIIGIDCICENCEYQIPNRRADKDKCNRGITSTIGCGLWERRDKNDKSI